MVEPYVIRNLFPAVIALISCLALCGIGLLVYPSVWAVALALSLSAAGELLYCRIISRRRFGMKA